MSALDAVYYFACYSVNLLNLGLLIALHRRDRREGQRQELLFMGGMMLISLSLTLARLGSPSAPTERWLGLVWMVSVTAGICLVTGATPGYLHSFRPSRMGRRITIAAWVAAACLFSAVLTEIALSGTNYLTIACFLAMLAAIVWGVVWFFVQVARHRTILLAEPAARVMLGMCLVTVAAMPFIALNDFFNAIPILRAPDGGQRLVLVPLFLAVWSVALLRKNLRALAHHAPHCRDVSPTGTSETEPAAPADLAACFGLSERELEVLPWLAAGLSYEAIGDKLCISHSTVKTHVRSIYKKTGVSGKIALISLLRELNHPIG